MLVLADDLTGANDTAIQYKKCGASSLVCVRVPNSLGSGLDGYDVLAVNTDSRALSPRAAYDAVSGACALFRGTERRVYKKVDSVLRGNPGAELDAVMDAFAVDAAFVCPVYPENGRTIRDGVLYAGDAQIDAVKTFSSDMKRGVSSVPLAFVRKGQAALLDFVKKEREAGKSVFVFDACSDEDLQTVCGVERAYDKRCVLCGSAGLARFDAMRFEGKATHEPTVEVKSGVTLVITGSRSKETRAQIEKLSAATKTPCIIVDKKLLEEGGADEAIDKCMAEAKARVVGGSPLLIIALSSLFEDFRMVLKDSEENYRRAERLAACVGKIAGKIYDAFPVNAIIACGGDTILQICDALGTVGIEPLAEVESGTPVGVFVGGKADGLPLVTKSGGFGSESVLIKGIEYLRNCATSRKRRTI